MIFDGSSPLLRAPSRCVLSRTSLECVPGRGDGVWVAPDAIAATSRKLGLTLWTPSTSKSQGSNGLQASVVAPG